MNVDRTSLYLSLVASVVLAIPLVSLISAMVIFPLAAYALLALIANFMPAAILAARTFGLPWEGMAAKWLYATIMWTGCAHGLARWGDAAGTMGGKNMPYFEVVFAPWLFAADHPPAF